MTKGWKLIQDVIEIGNVEPFGLFLGCEHESIEMKLNNGNTARGMRYNVEGSLKECVALYQELAAGITGSTTKLPTVWTPFIQEDVKSMCEAASPIATGKGLECPWCKFTFPVPSFNSVELKETPKKEEWWKVFDLLCTC